MDDLEGMLTGLLDNPIYRSTIIARSSLPALRVYLLANLCPTKVVNVRLAEVSEKSSSFILRQKNPTAILCLSDRVNT